MSNPAPELLSYYDLELFEIDGLRLVQLRIFGNEDPNPIIDEVIPDGCTLFDHDFEDGAEVFVFTWD